MREKYIEQRFPPYFEFGKRPSDGWVGLERHGGNGPVTDHVMPPDLAATIIADRQAMYNMLVELAQEFDKIAPEAFSAIWYKS